MNTREESKPSNRPDSERPRRWDGSEPVASIPVGRIAGTDVSVSYAIFFAAAAVFGAVAVLAGRAGNSDLVHAALTGAAVWMSGLVVQLAVALGFAAFAGLRLRAAGIGIVGLELPVHRWSPDRTALLVVFMLQVLAAMGFALWLIGASDPGGGPAGLIDETNRRIGWSMPSLGFTKADEAWRASAWLIWFQMLCQIIPMPRTLGRLGLLAVVGLVNRSVDIDPKIATARKLIRSVSLGVLLIALSFSLSRSESALPVWLLIAILSALLWASAGSRDLAAWLDGFAMAGLPEGATDTCPTLVDEIRRRTSEARMTKKLKQVHAKERAEAVDAERLDDILQRLHDDGPESLTEEEREVLRRVSNRLRQRRED